MKNIIIISAIVAVAVGAGAFYGGLRYGQAKVGSFKISANGGQARLGQGGQFNRQGRVGQAGGFVSGEIIAKDDKSLTVKLSGGGSKIIFLSDKTQIMKSVDGSISDLSVGQNVMVNGSANTDGSITAQAVQLRTAAPQK